MLTSQPLVTVTVTLFGNRDVFDMIGEIRGYSGLASFDRTGVLRGRVNVDTDGGQPALGEAGWGGSSGATSRDTCGCWRLEGARRGPPSGSGQGRAPRTFTLDFWPLELLFEQTPRLWPFASQSREMNSASV